MPDEKIDRIDKRVSELVNIVGNLVTTVTELSLQQKVTTEQISALTEQQKAFAEQQKILTAQLSDVVRVVISLDKKQDVTREEMNENFEKIHNESRILHRKTDWASATSLDADKRVEALETRVTKLEEKLAA